MCGIAGFKAFGAARPGWDEVERLLLGIESRGRDATGVAFLDEAGELRVVKAPVPATEFVRSKRWKALRTQPVPAILIMHTRAGTRGSEKNNKNNHPVFNKMGMALVHNGVISNYEEVSKDQVMDAEVDTEVILRQIESGWWDDVEKLNALSGSFACAVINKERPKELMLFRHTSPLVLAMDAERDVVVFASTKEAIGKMQKSWMRGFVTHKRPPLHAYEVADDSAFLVDETGVRNVKTLSPKKETRTYGGRWEEGSKEKCPVCGEKVWVLQYSAELGRRACWDCRKKAEEGAKPKTGMHGASSRFTEYYEQCGLCGVIHKKAEMWTVGEFKLCEKCAKA